MKAFDVVQGKLLLSHNPKRGWWDAPGGRILPGETLREALERECREEIGIAPSSMSENPVHTWSGFTAEHRHFLIGVAFAVTFPEYPVMPIHGSEHDRIELFDRAAMDALPMPSLSKPACMGYLASIEGAWTVLQDRIAVDIALAIRNPMIAGTRVPVATVVGEIINERPWIDICREFHITAAQLNDAVTYAALALRNNTLHASF